MISSMHIITFRVRAEWMRRRKRGRRKKGSINATLTLVTVNL